MWGPVFSVGNAYYHSISISKVLGGFGCKTTPKAEEVVSVREAVERETVEMFSVDTQKHNQYKNGDRKGKGVLVDDGYPNGSLKHLHDQLLLGGFGNAMLASQEIQGPQTPTQTHSRSVVENEKEKPEQPPKEKPSILLFTTHVKPRLKWTPKLHARFTDAIIELGGASKATPKAVQTVMDLDGLSLFHVKSHLQKYRLGKVTVKEFKPKNIRPRRKNMSSRAKGPRYTEVKKTSTAKTQRHGELYLKLQEARRRYIDKTQQDAWKNLVNPYTSEANAGVASMFRKNLAGVGTLAKPPYFYSTLQGTYSPYNTLERIKECLGLPKQSSSFNSYQPLNVAHSTNGINVQVGLKEQPKTFLHQNVAYSATGGFVTSYNSTNAIDVPVGLKEQPQSFLSQNAAYSFQLQNAAYGYQPQNAAYGYQPRNAAFSAFSAASYFPTSNSNYSGAAGYSATSIFPTSNGNCSGTAGYSATSEFPTTNSNYSGTAGFSATGIFPTSNGNCSGTAGYSATNDFPTSNRNNSGSATYSTTNDFPTSNSTYSGSAGYSSSFDFPTSDGNYSGSAAYSTTNLLPVSDDNLSGNAAYSANNNFTTPKAKYSETAYLEDLTAALAAISNKSLETTEEDPVDTYMNWDNPEPSINTNGVAADHPK